VAPIVTQPEIQRCFLVRRLSAAFGMLGRRLIVGVEEPLIGVFRFDICFLLTWMAFIHPLIIFVELDLPPDRLPRLFLFLSVGFMNPHLE